MVLGLHGEVVNGVEFEDEAVDDGDLVDFDEDVE